MKTLKHKFKRIHKIEQLEAKLRDNPEDKNLSIIIKRLKNLDKVMSELEDRFYNIIKNIDFNK